jgi:4-hydroxybenzoate polyprenyltransferase
MSQDLSATMSSGNTSRTFGSIVSFGLVCRFGFLFPLASLKFLLWLIPGASIAIIYVVPVLSKGRRLKDLGWTKTVLIGWSWAWLTAFIPALYFNHEPLYMSTFLGIGRMLFIIAITIPFEIRDITIDSSVGLNTMPAYFGLEKTIRAGIILCILLLIFFTINSIHYHSPAYGIAMSSMSLLTIWILRKSQYEKDDYFFSGLTDGTMIMALIIYWVMTVL